MRLSKFFYIPASIIIILKLICCDVDKLNLINPNVLTPETFFTTENQVQQAVNAVYAMDNMAYEQVMNPAAEVENEFGNIPEAIDYLNRVRNRADVMMPNYGTPAITEEDQNPGY
jgi:hypothetical protein